VPGRAKRVCLLSGASGTLGSAFCRLYGERYDIAAVYRTRPPPVASQRRWFMDPVTGRRVGRANRPMVFEIQADLSLAHEVDRVVDVTLARFGRIDLLVNAAAVMKDAPFLDPDRFEEALQEQLLVNSLLPHRLTANVSMKFWRGRRAANLRANRNVVNVSSVSGLAIYPRSGRAAYGASKAVMNFLSCQMATECRRFGVRVNVVAPTTFPKLVPTQRVAAAIAGLDRQRMSGRILVVDRAGNRYAR